jgi:hypothetical protein
MMNVFQLPLTASSQCESVVLGREQRTRSERALAKRTATLDGAVVALIDNTKNSPHFPQAVISELQRRYPIERVIWIVKSSMSVPLDDEAWNLVRAQASVAVTMYGECGSCSSQSIRDALELEWSGIPAVCIAHEALAPSIDAMKSIAGMPDYPYVTVSFPAHPNAPLSADQCQHWAAELAPAIGALLTTAAPEVRHDG